MLKLNKVYKYRIYPTKEQEILIQKTFGCVRFIHNKLLHTYITTQEQHGKNKFPTPAMFKKHFPFLKEVDSLALSNAQIELQKALKNCFRRDKNFPDFKRKNDRQSYTTHMVNRNIVLSDHLIKLPKLKWVKINQHREIPSDHKIKSCTIFQTNNKYDICILTEYMVQTNDLVQVGTDNTDTHLETLQINGQYQSFDYPDYIKETAHDLQKAMQICSRRQKNSKRWFKQQEKVHMLREKLFNQKKNYIHHMSKELAEKYDSITFYLPKNDSKGTQHEQEILLNFLSYKLREQGKKLIRMKTTADM